MYNMLLQHRLISICSNDLIVDTSLNFLSLLSLSSSLIFIAISFVVAVVSITAKNCETKK
ncbi:hypothetical protein DERP_000700 [Dermatophagoides pteronyssinus]|uniref:Uncharacterized protein n=1 Tax=Dermatophagoides pteronyssinus TaxID=6956 RepID=A0ABQ8J174_DERPT|nr:hypothetical protein DERP_000700 [Dermatophagoides pteronyssinus]